MTNAKRKIKIIKIRAKNAFVRTKIPNASYVINHYVGCSNACLYCYARFVKRIYNIKEKWGSFVIVKENIPNLVKGKYVDGKVIICSVSDAYQEIEKELLLTRKLLENLNKKIFISILTKNELIRRDANEILKFEKVEVGFTINGFEKKVKKAIEPFSSSHEERVEGLKFFNELKRYNKNLKTFTFISPVIPSLVDVEKVIDEVKSFTDFFIIEFLNLQASSWQFRKWLKENYLEDFETFKNKEKFENFFRKVKEIVRKKNVKASFVIHKPFKLINV